VHTFYSFSTHGQFHNCLSIVPLTGSPHTFVFDTACRNSPLLIHLRMASVASFLQYIRCFAILAPPVATVAVVNRLSHYFRKRLNFASHKYSYLSEETHDVYQIRNAANYRLSTRSCASGHGEGLPKLTSSKDQLVFVGTVSFLWIPSFEAALI
jgi:hypothetical protein